MVTDRRVTRCKVLVDPDANKNIVFKARNAVVAIGYTGMAQIGTMPTDQWIAQALTGLIFPEGRHGPGSVPTLMTRNYEERYWGIHLRLLRERLNSLSASLSAHVRAQWVERSFDLLVTGWEWNYGIARPLIQCLSKAERSTTFVVDAPTRCWYFRRDHRSPVRMHVAPYARDLETELTSVRTDLALGDRTDRAEPGNAVDQAESMMAELIRKVSARSPYVGPDLMSILLPPPMQSDPIVRIRYLPSGRDTGVLVTDTSRRVVPVAFAPWILCSGLIRSPAVMTNLSVTSQCGPYRVVIAAPSVDGGPRAISSQGRPQL
jgi:hypothetical protein